MKENTLKFRDNGKFKILQFTDVHYDCGSEEDIETVELMRKLVKEEAPDFIMLTGDISTGKENVRYLADALAPVTESGIPWALTFGNHDAEYGENHEALLAKLSTLPNGMTSNDPAAGFGKSNFVLPVEDKNGKTPWFIYGIDSNMYNENKLIEGYDFIHRPQIDWFLKQHHQISAEHKEFGALAFFHIALPEYNDVWDYECCYGEKREAVCCPKQNSGMFSAMLETGTMRGVFVGHDHVNDYWGELYGIRLCFGRATGYNTYGGDNFLHGARIIVLDANDTTSFQTYIRLSDNSIITKQPKHQPERIRID